MWFLKWQLHRLLRLRCLILGHDTVAVGDWEWCDRCPYTVRRDDV